jgi:DNA-binding response OmpR family regulator
MILILEGDEEMKELMVQQLKSAYPNTVGVGSAVEALQKLKNEKFDLLILDWVLPETSGIEFIRQVRQLMAEGRVPNALSILILTARTEPEDLIQALDVGADDYLAKPFDRALLLARVRALLRRLTPLDATANGEKKIVLGALTIHPASDDVFCGAERIHLTPSEFKLLHALACHRGKVLTREKLIALVQGEGIAVIDRAVDTHVFGLRKKLGSCADAIETVRGVGYRVHSTFTSTS